MSNIKLFQRIHPITIWVVSVAAVPILIILSTVVAFLYPFADGFLNIVVPIAVLLGCAGSAYGIWGTHWSGIVKVFAFLATLPLICAGAFLTLVALLWGVYAN